MSERYDFESTTNVIFPKFQRLFTSIIIDEDGNGFTIARNPKRFDKEGHIQVSEISSVDVIKKNVKMIGGGYKFSMIALIVIAVISFFIVPLAAVLFLVGAASQYWLLKTEGYNVTIVIHKKDQPKPIEIMCHYDEEKANEFKHFISTKIVGNAVPVTEGEKEVEDGYSQFCTGCGSPIDIGSAFCSRCGKRVE